MITVFYTQISDQTTDSLVAKAMECFSLPECEEYISLLAKKGNEDSAKESLAALILLGRAAEWMGIDARELTLSKTENGKPYFVDSSLSFSITHSNGTVAVALSDEGGIGIDLETAEYDSKKARRIAERYFTEDEKKEFAVSEGKISQRFARIWTKKEALVKLLGITLAEQISGAWDIAHETSIFYRYFEIDGHPLTLCTLNEAKDVTFGEEKL